MLSHSLGDPAAENKWHAREKETRKKRTWGWDPSSWARASSWWGGKARERLRDGRTVNRLPVGAGSQNAQTRGFPERVDSRHWTESREEEHTMRKKKKKKNWKMNSERKGWQAFFLFFQISNYLEAQLSCRSSLAMQVLSRWILDLGTLIGDSSCEILTLATGTGTETVYLSLLAWEMTWWWVVPVHYCLVRVVAAFFIFFFLQY